MKNRIISGGKYVYKETSKGLIPIRLNVFPKTIQHKHPDAFIDGKLKQGYRIIDNKLYYSSAFIGDLDA